MDELFQLAEEDKRVVLIVGDLGFSVIDRFCTSFPKQFVNAGVAEQNMIGLAAGMALSGHIVFVYSIGNFPTLRCLEQIRNDVCYHQASVKVVAVGGGVSYGTLGASHHATEDLAVMRALPEMLVVAPGDPAEARWATRAVARKDGPAYLRLGKAGEVRVHAEQPELELGKAAWLRPGADATIFSIGTMLPTAVQAADLLACRGIEVGVASMHTLRPLDNDAVVAAAMGSRAIFTLEEHSIVGGLGSAVAEVIAELDQPHASLTRIGLPSEFNRLVGTPDHLRARHGLDADSVAARMETTVRKGYGLVR